MINLYNQILDLLTLPIVLLALPRVLSLQLGDGSALLSLHVHQ
ncbi:MAG: hypothetical protein M0008_03290 [Actinomycetota bacterium]|nr:hypothetical protein [Actinomycetota bacterium]